jgi:SAM-dependent methyltransferase
MKYLGHIFGKRKLPIPVAIDGNPSLGYEKRRGVYFFSLPLMWILALWVTIKKKILGLNLQINTYWFDGLSLTCRRVKEGAGTWRALDIIYNYQFTKNRNFNEWLTDFWLGTMNAQAVRNRLRLVKYLLKKKIAEFAKDGEVRLLSIASGSAPAVLDAIGDLKQQGILVRAVLIDIDRTALDHTEKLAKEKGIEKQITFLRKGVNSLDKEKELKRFYPHIVEMIGFLEYRSRSRAVRLVKTIHRLLVPGGMFLTSNICSNPERPFIHWVVNWSMVYRPPKELAQIVIEGGFSNISQIVYEPLKIHSLAICQKKTR